MNAILVLLAVVCAHAYPTHDASEDIRALKFVSYVENFKSTMADYVSNEFKHLTAHDREEVEAILEEFLLGFGKDVAEVLIKNEGIVTADGVQIKQLDDGISVATADEIKATLLKEFPDINESDADVIVYKIRLNLLATRKKLDGVIERSKVAMVANS